MRRPCQRVHLSPLIINLRPPSARGVGSYQQPLHWWGGGVEASVVDPSVGDPLGHRVPANPKIPGKTERQHPTLSARRACGAVSSLFAFGFTCASESVYRTNRLSIVAQKSRPLVCAIVSFTPPPDADNTRPGGIGWYVPQWRHLKDGSTRMITTSTCGQNQATIGCLSTINGKSQRLHAQNWLLFVCVRGDGVGGLYITPLPLLGNQGRVGSGICCIALLLCRRLWRRK